MPYIVNLSAIHTLHPISTNLDAFTEICNRYSTGCWSGCCPSFFQSWTNYGWVAYQYNMKYQELIEPYRLGQITTDQFLANLAAIFDFLEESDLDQEALTDDESWVYYSNNPVYRILERAWSAGIDLDDSSRYRLPHLTSLREPVFLVSNTNELDALRILALLKAQNPEIKFNKNIDLSIADDKNPIKIAPNIYLCLSYRFQYFKTTEQNESVTRPSTMSLLRYLVEFVLEAHESEIEVISQYEGDLREAEKIGIPKANLHSADDYFSDNLAPSEIIII
ncbi:hypothetical protein BN59_01855 [Legionella massiliensis]|uniref:Uncharacterized protein n=1 Tax=Legionella massiliensis TaxID=1034943 RepID=A0A078KX69_9GAMM|nr:hypothetical protein [Legionella massiliensis]CDZ77571.1 hypothetical protein BN59_01855 [Legionella massiliensis]CEE13309.1 hypothetical protein BN1094_01855 [Legionella massiliensis]